MKKNEFLVEKQLISDTMTFLRYVSADKESPEIVKHHARMLLNSYNCLPGIRQETKKG